MMNLYKSVFALSFVKIILLHHLFLDLQEKSVVQRQPSTGAFTSCSYLDFGVQAATISRKINYGVTQSRPEGGARLHTAKKKTPAPPSSLRRLKTKPEQQSSSEKEGKKGKRKGGIGLFSASVT